MKIFRAKEFTASKAWGALDIVNMRGIATRLHWTDQPYKWHTNDEDEVFVVLDGSVEMHFKEGGEIQVVHLGVGDIFCASIGTEHVAHPQGPAGILVVETEGCVQQLRTGGPHQEIRHETHSCSVASCRRGA